MQAFQLFFVKLFCCAEQTWRKKASESPVNRVNAAIENDGNKFKTASPSNSDPRKPRKKQEKRIFLFKSLADSKKLLTFAPVIEKRLQKMIR